MTDTSERSTSRTPDNMTTTTVLSERCPKCGQQMFNHPRSLTRCAKCGHEWSMKEPGVAPTSNERVRPKLTPNKSRQHYLEDLFHFAGLNYPRHVLGYSQELLDIIELYIDNREDVLRLHREKMDAMVERDRLRAALVEIGGYDCENYCKHLSPQPCGQCMPCIARKALSGEPSPSETDGWQPIETAPKDGRTILVKCGNWVVTAHWHPSQRWATCGPSYEALPADEQPEKWAPVPGGAPPEKASADTDRCPACGGVPHTCPVCSGENGNEDAK